MALSTFNVSDVLLKLAEQEGIYLSVEGVDDVCYGCVIAADKTFNSFLTQHALPYNWQIIDGYPIRVVRRPINDSLTIDHTITQDDCVVSGGPAVSVKRIDVSELPRELEIQYIDPDRQFANTTRTARHTGAPTTNPGTSIEIDFLISATQAREMAFDTLYRIWAQQLSLSFEHRDITIEPGDTVHITCDQGVYVVLVQEATYTVARTTQVLATVLLASSGITIDAGTWDNWPPAGSPDTTSPDVRNQLVATFAGAGQLVAAASLTNPILQASAAFIGSGNLAADAAISTPQSLTALFSGTGNLVASSNALLGANISLAGTGNMAANVDFGYTVAFTQTLSADDSGGANISERIICGTLSAGGTQIRVKFKSSSTAPWNVDNVGVGTRSSTYITTATPVELLFAGGHGFALGSGSIATSDWATFSTSPGDTLVVIFDNSSANGNPAHSATGGSRYWLSGDSYNIASPGGSWSSDNHQTGVLEIDVR